MCTASLFCHISFFDPFSLSLSFDLGKLPTACIITAFFGRFVCFYFWHTCTTRTNGTHLLSPQYFLLHLVFCLRVCLLAGSSEMMLLRHFSELTAHLFALYLVLQSLLLCFSLFFMIWRNPIFLVEGSHQQTFHKEFSCFGLKEEIFLKIRRICGVWRRTLLIRWPRCGGGWCW